jgi:hypothetical protein
MADQRTPQDRGTGPDPEDYPPDTGPVPVGHAPVRAEHESENLPVGAASPLTPAQERERARDMAAHAVRPEVIPPDPRTRETHAKPSTASTPQATDQDRPGTA